MDKLYIYIYARYRNDKWIKIYIFDFYKISTNVIFLFLFYFLTQVMRNAISSLIISEKIDIFTLYSTHNFTMFNAKFCAHNYDLASTVHTRGRKEVEEVSTSRLK